MSAYRTNRTDDELDSPLPNPVIEPYANDVFPCIDGNGVAAAGHVAGEAVEVGVEVLRLRRQWTPDDELDPHSQGPAEVVCAIRPERRSRGARDEATDRRAGGHIRHDGIEGISKPQAGGAKPIAPHFATRDAGQRGDGPPDAGPGEIGFHAPDERFAGLQVVADRATNEAAGEIVSAAAEVGDRGPIRPTPRAAAVDADIGAGPIIGSYGGEGDRRRKCIRNHCRFIAGGVGSGRGKSRRRGKYIGSDNAFDLGRQGWARSSERYQHGNCNWELSHDTHPPVT